MAEIKLSDYIAKRLKEHGVNRVFMVSGGGAMHLNDSLGHNIPYTAYHNEQGAAIAAEGYARVNQKLGVVNVTTGPGGLNALNGVMGQWTDSAPVLYISGQVKRRTMMESFPELNLRQLGDQEVDIISIVKPLTKYAVTVNKPEEIKYHIDRAIYEATHGRFGPVWINVPIDVQAAPIDENTLVEFTPSVPTTKTDNKIQDVVNKLQNARRPLIIAGHGIRLAGVQDQFLKMLNETNIPVVTTFNGMDLLPSDHKNYVGRIGTIGQRAGNFALQNADLILCLGTRNNVRQVSYNWENFAKNAYKIVVDIDKAELDKPLVVPDIKVNADLKEFVPELAANLPARDYGDWAKFCSGLRDRYSYENHPEHPKPQKNVINPYRFTYALTDALKPNDIFIMANGSACVCTFQNAVIKDNQRFILNSGDASMGYGLPASIGAAHDANGRNVICLEGDGSIMMNLQELQTMASYKLPIKLFVINNNGYSSIRQTQRNFFDGRMTASGADSGVEVPDFVRVSDAFGIPSVRISNPRTMKSKIARVLNTPGPVLCEVMVEPEYAFLPKLSSRKLPDGTMVSPSLEDMFPFLDRAEFEKNMMYNKQKTK